MQGCGVALSRCKGYGWTKGGRGESNILVSDALPSLAFPSLPLPFLSPYCFLAFFSTRKEGSKDGEGTLDNDQEVNW